MLACPQRDLPHRGGGLPDSRGDLRVGHIKNLVEHEHSPLCRLEGFEHGQHRHRDALREFDILGDISAVRKRPTTACERGSCWT
jgi:hypothetical protein